MGFYCKCVRGGTCMARMLSHEVYAPQDLSEEVRKYARDHGISESAAWRELARRGLQTQVDA